MSCTLPDDHPGSVYGKVGELGGDDAAIVLYVHDVYDVHDALRPSRWRREKPSVKPQGAKDIVDILGIVDISAPTSIFIMITIGLRRGGCACARRDCPRDRVVPLYHICWGNAI